MTNCLSISLESTKDCVERKHQLASFKKLGQILIDKKIITEYQLHQAICLQSSSQLKLGEALMNYGHIVPSQLEDALREQQWRQQGFWVIG